ncbi:VOC family protein [Oceanicola sp. 502str15]|uniref:VOC family protein n=1 Tax=Oceanicola sp. 502str15 TaxID=2696061 RepID=UPI002094572D|nr:VOC family protein [Oceanicola sp. 502str15]MCO6382773.1 VOC family protein [Oceanicola sp. 502str15]
MPYRLGRLIDHIGLRVSDYPAARSLWLALFDALGLAAEVEEDPDNGLNLDELYIGPARPGGPVTRDLHICLQAPDRETVQRAHAAALAAGGRDNGAPGLRAYHPGYYAAFLLDPDGNNIEIKCDERAGTRSASHIDITP